MVLKNSDGSVYAVRSPNPLTKDQFWNELVLHNFVWDFIDTEDTLLKREKPTEKPPKREKQAEKSVEPEKQIEQAPTPEKEPEKPIEVEEQMEEVVIPEPEQEPESFIPIKTSLKEDRRILKNTVIIHCLPFGSGGYGKKFTFEGVIIKREDFGIIFWTPIKIDTLSIVYPSAYVDGGYSFGDYQWWKIDKIQPKNQGFIVHGIISEVQPDFS